MKDRKPELERGEESPPPKKTERECFADLIRYINKIYGGED